GDVRVDCEDPHPAEIIGSADFPDGPGAAFPGSRPGTEFADSACEDLLGRYGAIPGSLSIVAVGRPVLPYEWSTGVRDFLCLAVAVGADGTAVSVTGSFRTEWTPVP
ncbi:MAG TPA: septum formation family protein, partial [Acidimicrobiia bacterium]|nr:septum formation family protein [Acidimicrobiia bacterium]